MKKMKFVVLVAMLLAILASGCNLIATQKPTEIVFPTPNLTMTALFAPVEKATNTPPAPVVVTATQGSVQPSATQVPPTKTLAPTNIPPQATATTVKPTNTPTKLPSTATATPKPVVSVTAKFLTTAPKIDGDWGELDLTQYPIDNVVFGGANWSGASDLEASFKIAWDATYLYIATKVHDDKYVQKATGEMIYKGDSMEILVLNGNTIYQIGWTAGSGTVTAGDAYEAYRWYPTGKVGKLNDLVMAAVGGDGLYREEVAIPWTDLGINPANGASYRFAISVSDNDNATSNVQQTMLSNSPDRVLNDASTWGFLVLKK